MQRFALPVRVYIEDTDAGGIVYYANYLNYMERSRTEALRAIGVDLVALQRDGRRLFVVRQASVEYRAPARLDDELLVHTLVEDVRRASLVCRQSVTRGERTLVDATVRLACLDADSLAPAGIPARIREAMNS